MRDRLIKLISDIQDYGMRETDFTTHWRFNDRLADYLLENAVITLPCKLETKIYHIDLGIPEDEPQCYECIDNCSGFGEFYCDKNYVGWPSIERKIEHPEKVCPRFKPIIREETFTLNFWASYEKWFNKTWFLIKEEANKALEEFK